MDTAEGRLHAIHVSDGGVPKHPRVECSITANGLEGDRQSDVQHHGGPLRAVCLYSLELIEALQAEGHPIVPGSIGENLTISGLSWSALSIGSTIAVGPARLTLTGVANPCTHIAASFLDDAFVRVSQKVHPGWSRFYACVDREGVVRVGDPVRLV